MATITLGQLEDNWKALSLSGLATLVTQTALGASASYTQPGQHRFDDVLIGDVGAFAYVDQSGTLYLEESNDLSSWTQVSSLACSAGLNRMLPAALSKRYWRLRYVNGATAQGVFRLYQQAFPLLDLRTQVTGRNVTLGTYDQVLNTASGGGLTSITITPPSGELWRVKLLGIIVPAIAGSTGNHILMVRLHSSLAVKELVIVTATGTNYFGIMRNVPYGTTSSQDPTANAEFQHNLINACLSPSVPLIVSYQNSTDLVNSGTIQITLVREVEKIA